MFTLNRVKTNPAGFLSQVPKALDEKSIAGRILDKDIVPFPRDFCYNARDN